MAPDVIRAWKLPSGGGTPTRVPTTPALPSVCQPVKSPVSKLLLMNSARAAPPTRIRQATRASLPFIGFFLLWPAHAGVLGEPRRSARAEQRLHRFRHREQVQTKFTPESRGRKGEQKRCPA